MFQFWFNTFFVSQAAVAREIYEDEPTLKTFEVDSDLRYFDVGKPDLDKAHKDDREKIYPSNFTVSAGLKTNFGWWLGKFLPGHVSSLTSQNIGGKVN